MAIAKRIFLFLVVNILVITTISVLLNLFGVSPYMYQRGIDYTQLAIFCAIWGFVGSFISLALSRVMAKFMMGVKVINPEQASGEAAWLVGTVYRLARDAGLRTMPEVGIYDAPELNAFATGPTKARALVAVSSGLLSRMGHDEVEGVLGHELTHVANGDMVTLTLIQGVMNAFVMFFSRAIAFALSQSVKEENRYMIRFAVTILLDILLGLLGAMVVAYFSRWREFRADRGGAQLAGRQKMINALQALKQNLNIKDQEHEKPAIAAFKISDGKRSFLSLLATHPPLETRIAALQNG